MEKQDSIEIEKRIRNQIISYLQLVSSEKELYQYEQDVPIANVAEETLAQWGDYFTMENFYDGAYGESVFSIDERQAMLAFEACVQYICHLSHREIDNVSDLIKQSWWPVLKNQATIALNVFLKAEAALTN